MIRILKIFTVILCSVMILYAQSSFTFTEEEVINLYNQMTELEHKDSTNTLVIKNLEDQIQLYLQQTEIDSGIIANYIEQIAIQKEMMKEIKPKWHENKYLWYSMGIASMIVPIWAVGQIK